MSHLTEVLSKHIAVFTSIGQPLKVGYPVWLEYVAYMQETLIDINQITFQLIYKHTKRAIHIYLKRIVNILLHSVWECVVADNAKRFITSKQAVGARESLDDIHILHQLIHIERIHPFWIVAGKHLRNHNE